MILVKIQGGLGNQMFQYAVGSIIAKKNKSSLNLDVETYNKPVKKLGFTPRNFELNIFDNKYQLAKAADIAIFKKLTIFNKVKKKLGFNYPQIVYEDTTTSDASMLRRKAPAYLHGYFQNYRYFMGHEAFVKNLFKFDKSKISNKNLQLAANFQQQNTVSVHVRRGDYVTDVVTNNFHGCCTLDYYHAAIKTVAANLPNVTIVFFSDDMPWVREHFESVKGNKIFVEGNIGADSWIDLYLMSHCGHNIIANSSFSWWGAWLNNNTEKIVVAPKNWFAGISFDINVLIPTEWIKM